MSPKPSPGISRRRALRQTFFYSAALALGQHTAADTRAASAPKDLHFLMLGDFGSAGQQPQHTLVPQVDPFIFPGFTAPMPPGQHTNAHWMPMQASVARAMQTYATGAGFRTEGIFMLGDNFYGRLSGGVNSPRWKTGFEEMYPASAFPGPCWAMLGNHDYDEEEGLKLSAELAYADAHPGTRWTMPGKWHRVDWPTTRPLITCLILDTNYKNGYLYLTAEERARQLSWMKAEMARPRVAPWLVCMGHHPLYSNGMHGDNSALIKDWGQLFEEQNVAFYFSGHDHDLQHLEFDELGTSFVISGGGGAHITDIRKFGRGLFSQAVNGFTHVQVSRERFTVRHLDSDAKELHAFSKTTAGQLEILS